MGGGDRGGGRGGDPRHGFSLSRSSSQKLGLSVAEEFPKPRPKGVPLCVGRGGRGLNTSWLLMLGCGEHISMKSQVSSSSESEKSLQKLSSGGGWNVIQPALSSLMRRLPRVPARTP